jgi:hypothetical protein
VSVLIEEIEMAYIERLRISKHVHTALKENSEGSLSEKINKAMRDLVEGRETLEDAHRDLVLTSFTTNPELIDQVKAIAKSKGLTFNKAMEILLTRVVSSTHH